MYQECVHLPSAGFCYCLLHTLTGSLQTYWRGPGVPVSRPPSFPCFPSSLFMLYPELLAALRTGLESGFPFWTPESVPWGRHTASWAATEVSFKKLDALEPGQRCSWCTCHCRVCWHGLPVCHSLLVGVVPSVPPSPMFYWVLVASAVRLPGSWQVMLGWVRVVLGR